SGEVLIAQEFLSACSSVDEIAAVLGHELAHYALSHPAERFSSFKLANIIYIIGLMVPIWFCIARLTYAVLAQSICTVLKFLCIYLPPMRQHEKEADIVGLQMMAKACYDARAATVIFTKLSEFVEEMEELPKRTPDNELHFKVIDCFATHPAFPLRIEHMEKLIPEVLKLRTQCNCPTLKSDPRQKLYARKQKKDEIKKKISTSY
ncbi:hypothetical protein ACJMK2_040474, partial [Sinanodonta woodiana]